MSAELQRSALLVIDPQNDFLTPGGAFSKRHVDGAQLVATLALVVQAARQQGRLVVWVTSRYGETPVVDREELRGQTHVGAPCCVAGSEGAQVVAPLRALQAADDLQVEKRWYSAFRESDLHQRLQAAGVQRLLLCGVATNVCVLATAREALGLGYQVAALSDACTAGTIGKHVAALRELGRAGGSTLRFGDMLQEAPAVLRGLGAGDTLLHCGALRDLLVPLAGDQDLYARVAAEVDFQTMRHRGGLVPRLMAVQGQKAEDGVEPLYRHPADEQPALTPFSPVVDAIRRAVGQVIGHPLNHCLIQHYRHGRDFIGEHTDKTLDVVRPSYIVNVSLGRTRTMVLKAKRAQPDGRHATQRVPLPDGSLFVMGLASNREFSHAVRPEGDGGDGDGGDGDARDSAEGARISLTFRHIGTFCHRDSGLVWGVGAPAATRAEAQAEAASAAAQDREAAAALAVDRMLRLFHEENADPDFDPAAYRPGFTLLGIGPAQG